MNFPRWILGTELWPSERANCGLIPECLNQPLLLFLLGVYVCMWVNVCAYHSVHVEVRGELQSQVSSLPAIIAYLPRIKLGFSGLICKCFYQYQWPILLAPDQIILFWLTNRLMIIKGVRVQKVAFSCTIISVLQGSTGKS